MSLIVLENLLDASKLTALGLTKSQSSCGGAALRKAHYELGEVAADHIVNLFLSDTANYAVVILMRAGLNFGLGVADSLESLNYQVSVYFAEKEGLAQEDLDELSGKKVVIVDAVVNTGKSVFQVLDQLEKAQAKDSVVATIVMPESAQVLANELNIISVRVSARKFKGAKVKTVVGGMGPDTGDRLFGTY
ncbi:MAG: phosphoribosyl transferase [bacterium]|nr:phosphoribosyl transferase [bacterium]